MRVPSRWDNRSRLQPTVKRTRESTARTPRYATQKGVPSAAPRRTRIGREKRSAGLVTLYSIGHGSPIEYPMLNGRQHDSEDRRSIPSGLNQVGQASRSDASGGYG